MKSILPRDFEQVVKDAEVLAREADGRPKVYLCPDGRFVKVFSPRRRLSSHLWQSYAERFWNSARELRARGVASVEATDCFRLRGTRDHAVTYKGPPGRPLRETVASIGPASPECAPLMNDLASLVADIHGKGVYFRGLHFGNIIVRPDGVLALIDVADVRFFDGPLNTSRRARNFKPPFRYEIDRSALEAFGVKRFVDRYLAAACLTPATATRFIRALSRQHPRLAAAGELRVATSKPAVSAG